MFIFVKKGEKAYREYQDAKVDDVLAPGVAFNFIKRLLSFNSLNESNAALIEVIVLSRNDPQTGLQVMKSIKAHGLNVTRAIFTQGKSLYNFIPVLNISLFLSANPQDVEDATNLGFSAGQVIGSPVPDANSEEILIAFDFDGVLAGDSAEGISQNKGMKEYQKHEAENASIPLNEGPLTDLLKALNRIRKHELEISKAHSDHSPKLRIAIVTAGNAPADERVLFILKEHGLYVNDAFFLGALRKL
nr:5'-nucleotidase [Gleimia sp. 6138-11-ORH1]